MPGFAISARLTTLGFCLVWLSIGMVVASESVADRKRELISLVRQDCGSCHGLTLAGGLGPPLLPQYLTEKPTETLVTIVMQGRPGTPMPGWSTFMNAQEAAWVVQMLKSGFPK
jgi:cytochrome c55X